MSMARKTKMTWVAEPPLPRGMNVDWKAVAEKAKSKPGHWLKVEERVNLGNAWEIRNGGLYGYFWPAGSFDAVIRNSSRDDSKGDLYVKYVGESEKESVDEMADRLGIDKLFIDVDNGSYDHLLASKETDPDE